MTFDRLAYVDELTRAGIDEPVARAHASALRAALDETVATKGDLRDLEHTLKADTSELGHTLRVDMRELEQGLKADFAELSHKIDGFDRKLADFDHKLQTTVHRLDTKIELAMRDLTIRGAAGLGVVVSVIIGLKLFG